MMDPRKIAEQASQQTAQNEQAKQQIAFTAVEGIHRATVDAAIKSAADVADRYASIIGGLRAQLNAAAEKIQAFASELESLKTMHEAEVAKLKTKNRRRKKPGDKPEDEPAKK